MTDEQTATSWWRRVDPCVPGWLLAAAVVWGSHGFQDDLSRDSALYVYAGQEIAAGDAPYVGVLNRAGPLAQLLPWLGVELGRLLGTGDVIGVRIVFFALLVVTPALVHVLTRDGFGSRLAGCAAAATLLAFTGLALSATDGPQSKQPMMLALLVALILLTRRRWVAAGIATSLATLTWQPALLVLAVAALVTTTFSPGTARSRAADLARFAAGGALALVAVVAYFLAIGALPAFVEGFWSINAGFTAQEGLVTRPGRAWTDLTAWLGWTTWLLMVGCVLSILLGAVALLRRPLRADAVALGAATLVGLAWSGLAFNGAPDSLLLLPQAAAGIGGTVALVAERVPVRRVMTVAVAAWVVVALAATGHVTWTSRAPELPAARADAEAAFADLPAGATVFAFDAPQPLALTGRSSISRFVLFGEGMRDYVAAQSPDGIGGYVSAVDAREPTLVVTSMRGLTGVLRPLARDYTEVGGGTGWRAFVREESAPG